MKPPIPPITDPDTLAALQRLDGKERLGADTVSAFAMIYENKHREVVLILEGAEFGTDRCAHIGLDAGAARGLGERLVALGESLMLDSTDTSGPPN